MGFLSDILATIGIGGTKIDAQLHRSKVRIGQEITGEIHVFGGNVDQMINEFDLILYTQAEQETENGNIYVTLPVQKTRISQTIQVKAGTNYVIPFAVPVPLHAPVSVGRVQLWLGTEADISNAVDAKDRDHVEVLAHPAQLTVLEALETLGFRFVKCDNEYRRNFPGGYEQEFEFAPSAEFRKYLDELEVSFELRADELIVKLTIDRRARGLNLLFGAADQKVHVNFPLDAIEQHGESYVSENLRRIIHEFKK